MVVLSYKVKVRIVRDAHVAIHMYIRIYDRPHKQATGKASYNAWTIS